MKIKAKKLKMTQIWKGDKVVPVTILEVADEKDDEEAEPFDNLNEGEKVTVSGISKGKGFQGVIKKHGFAKQPKSHGQKHTLRKAGSIGPTEPKRTFPGVKMAGRMGGDRVTVKNLLVARVEEDKNKVMLKGAVPGWKGAEVEIRLQKES